MNHPNLHTTHDEAIGLEALGWRPSLAEQITAQDARRGPPGRIIQAFRKSYLVHTGAEVVEAVPRGAMHHHARGRVHALPTVGDWVILERFEGRERARVWRVLDRDSALVRQAAGGRGAQLIAANLDTIFIVTSMNQEFNPRRLERYLALVWEAGAEPVLVLSKADLVEAVAPFIEQARAIAPQVRCVAISSVTQAGLDEFDAIVAPGHTIALIGSSGVGKSTLLNRLYGEDVQATADIRERDDRGRHTTTTRQLVILPGGGLIIDTPGMRELYLWDSDTGRAEAFEEIETLAAECKFRDCRHEHEADCAVKRAVERGELDPDRLANWRKLLDESRGR